MTMAAQNHTQLTWYCMKGPKTSKNGIHNKVLIQHLFLVPVNIMTWIPHTRSFVSHCCDEISSSTLYYLCRRAYLLALVPFSLSLLPPLRKFLWYGDSIPKGLYSLVGVRPKRCRDRVCGVTGECGDSFFRR
jgi:hypothetical protein